MCRMSSKRPVLIRTIMVLRQRQGIITEQTVFVYARSITSHPLILPAVEPSNLKVYSTHHGSYRKRISCYYIINAKIIDLNV